ncbi:MAG: alpha/beta fold hydrolase [Myxococcota bacterium]|nr:alpha/beta fold hydrolase [Myxococcota bacterium]
MSKTQFHITTADNCTLDVVQITSQTTVPVACLILTHAMMVDARTFCRRGKGMAETFARLGWTVFLPNFRGRGQSGTRPEQGGSWTYDDIVRYDLPAIVHAVRQHVGSMPLVLGGHSLGGHASVATAGLGLFDQAPDAYLLLSANVWRPGLEPSFIRRVKKSASFTVFYGITRAFGYFPSRTLRFGSCNEALDYVSDLRRSWSTDRWRSRNGVDNYTEAASRVSAPILSVIGAGDTLMAHPIGAERWFKDVGFGTKEFWLAEAGQFGLDFDPDHMTLVTSPRAAPLWLEMERWLSQVLELTHEAGKPRRRIK